jgi:hypothetical protein
MASTIIIPKSTHVKFDIPEEYVGTKLEIIYPELFEAVKKQPKKTMADFVGFMYDETANEIRKNIEDGSSEWERDI